MNDSYVIWRKVIITTRAVADPGEGPGGGEGAAQLLFLDQTEARRAEKKFEGLDVPF